MTSGNETKDGPAGLLHGRRARWVIGATGLLVFALGLFAVFSTSNGAGSAALVTIGTAVCLLAVLGPDVRSIKLPNGFEAEFHTAAELVRLAAEKRAEGGEEVAADLEQEASEVLDRRQALSLWFKTPGSSVDWSSQWAQYIAQLVARAPSEYERQVISVVREAFGDRAVSEPPGTRVIDAIVRVDTGTKEKTVGIEIRAGTSFNALDALRPLVTKFPDGLDSVLFVVNADPDDRQILVSQGALRLYAEQGPDNEAANAAKITVMGWRQGHDPELLIRAISGEAG